MNKKPEVGQWWVNVVGDPPRVHKTGIVLFVGRDSKKRLLWEDCQGHIETDYNLDWSGWHHEPACTGWDWVPVVKEGQKWPQWLIPSRTEVSEVVKKPIAFYRRDGEHSGETFHTDGSSFKWGSWEHLTDCRVCSEREALDQILPEEEFPQWYEPLLDACAAYGIRTSPTSLTIVHHDGSTLVREWMEIDEKRVKLTREQAESRVKMKLLSPDVVNDLMGSIRKETKADVVERLDDWVTQDRVHARKGVDEYRWVKTHQGVMGGSWTDVFWTEQQEFAVHGRVDEMGDRFECRCRRKDLPGVEPKTTASVTVYEVVYGDYLNAMAHNMVACDSQLASMKRTWKYVSVVSTKTVEVML